MCIYCLRGLQTSEVEGIQSTAHVLRDPLLTSIASAMGILRPVPPARQCTGPSVSMTRSRTIAGKASTGASLTCTGQAQTRCRSCFDRSSTGRRRMHLTWSGRYERPITWTMWQRKPAREAKPALTITRTTKGERSRSRRTPHRISPTLHPISRPRWANCVSRMAQHATSGARPI